jgi:hypothetical protein
VDAEHLAEFHSDIPHAGHSATTRAGATSLGHRHARMRSLSREVVVRRGDLAPPQRGPCVHQAGLAGEDLALQYAIRE